MCLAHADSIGHSADMCGRFNVIDSPGLQQLLQDLGIDLTLPPPVTASVNIAPTDAVPLVRNDLEGRVMEAARWWLTPSWADKVSQKYAMFNARSETLGKSAAFRGPFKSRRGIVAMSSFIEWRKEGSVKQPWLVSNESNALAVAALWDVWSKGETPLVSCTLVTTAAAPEFAPWHTRMPVLLAATEQERWLDNDTAVAADDELFDPRLKEPLLLAPLDRAVSNARNRQERLLEPIGDVVVLRA